MLDFLIEEHLKVLHDDNCTRWDDAHFPLQSGMPDNLAVNADHVVARQQVASRKSKMKSTPTHTCWDVWDGLPEHLQQKKNTYKMSSAQNRNQVQTEITQN